MKLFEVEFGDGRRWIGASSHAGSAAARAIMQVFGATEAHPAEVGPLTVREIPQGTVTLPGVEED